MLESRCKSIDEVFEFNNSIFLQHPDSIIPESSRLMAKTVMTHPEETLFLLSLMSGPVGRLTSAGLLFYDINENGLQISHLMGLTGTAASRVRAINTFGPGTGKTLGWLDNKLAEPAVMGRIKAKGEAFATKLKDWVSQTSGPLNRQLRPAHAMPGPRQSRNIEALDLPSKPKVHHKSTSISSAKSTSSSSSSTSSSSTTTSGTKTGTQIRTERANQKFKEHAYHRAPKTLQAFPDAVKDYPKTSIQGGGGKRNRWVDKKYIYEWDRQHGTVEKYNKTGQRHLGEFDPNTGKQLKSANPTRRIEK